MQQAALVLPGCMANSKDWHFLTTKTNFNGFRRIYYLGLMKKMVPPKVVVLLLVLATAAYFGIKKVVFSLTHETTDNAQVETQIVPVLPRVSGYIKALFVKDYGAVAKGQLLAVLDDAELQVQLQEAAADLRQAQSDAAAAKAAIQSAQAAIAVSNGVVQLSEVKLQKALTDDERDQRLLAEGAITRKAAEETHFSVSLARQALLNSKSELSLAQSKIAGLKASLQRCDELIEARQARMEQLNLKLTYTKIFSPIDGRIGKLNVAEGQLVQAGTPFFSVVNDSAFWVIANFKENQLAALLPGKKVQLRIDAYPDLNITGTVASMSEATGAKFALIPPDNASGNFVKVTQRVPIKIEFDSLHLVRSFLRAGMSVFVTATKN